MTRNSNRDAPCDNCKHAPCTYISATHCEKLNEWTKSQESIDSSTSI